VTGRIGLVWVLGIWLLIFAMPAASVRADDMRPGYLEFSQTSPGDWTLIWKAPTKGGMTYQTSPVLPAGCKVRGAPEMEFAAASVTARYNVRCSESVSGKKIGLSGFENSQTDALVRVAATGRPIMALRLTAGQPLVVIPNRPDRMQVARTYFVTGAEHIVFGYDHLLFVAAMVLLLGSTWPVAKAITAFTVAHSITLIGATIGFFSLPQRPVEAIIALSILFLAVEIIKREPGNPRLSERAPWVVAFAFGLLHGFGFAGALKEIGLPETDVPAALLTFNLGVEAGQLAIVGLILLIMAALRHYAETLLRPAVIGTTYAIGSTASFWFIERIMV
jgi:hydrogenase/urease accessory protein HupE